MSEFKHVNPLTVGDHVIAKVEVYYIGDCTETTTEMWIGSEPIPHDEAMLIAPWMLTALGLPDLSALQRRVEELTAALRPVLEAYVTVTNSGDCGFGEDAELDPMVIAARKALEGNGNG